jgi:hypothetical protein
VLARALQSFPFLGWGGVDECILWLSFGQQKYCGIVSMIPGGKHHRMAITWGRCYDHNFLRFLTIFGEKIGVFLKNNVMIQILQILALL